MREPGFPDAMPCYFRHTSRFEHQHARSLMRLRCCSDPFAASTTLHWGGPNDSGLQCVPPAPPKRPRNSLLDCPVSIASLRADARFASLFAQPLPAGAPRWPAFVRTHDQWTHISFIHAYAVRIARNTLVLSDR
jgi:hypothetical protein